MLLLQTKQEATDLAELMAEKDKEIVELQKYIQELKDENQRLSEELMTLTNHKVELETRSISRQDYDELDGKLQTVSGWFLFYLIFILSRRKKSFSTNDSKLRKGVKTGIEIITHSSA